MNALSLKGSTLWLCLTFFVIGCTSQVEEAIEVASSQSESEVEPVVEANAPYCVTESGIALRDGESLEVFPEAVVRCGTKCEASAKTITCQKGKIIGPSAYAYTSCVEQPCRCKYGNFYLNEGQQVTFFNRSTGSCENPTLDCRHSSNQAVVRCLAGGRLEGPSPESFPHRSCTTPTCFCTLPNGIQIPRGSSRTVFVRNEVDCNGNCHTTENRGTVACDNLGQLSGDIAKANFNSCQVPNCDCSLSSGLKVVFGADLTVYSRDKVPCGQKCSDFSGVVSCRTRNVASAVPATALTFPHAFCSQDRCEGEGGGNGGGTGNDNGPGQGWFEDGSGGGGGGGGGPASSMALLKTGCSTPWDALADTYRQPGNHKGKLSDGTRIVAFRRATVECGDHCTNHSQTRICQNGVWSGGADFNLKECRSVCP